MTEVSYDFSQVSTINHDHRRALNLSMEDYVVLSEIALNCSMVRMDVVDHILNKTGLSLNRVVIILTRLKSFSLIEESGHRFLVSMRWYDTAAQLVKS